MTQGKVLGIFLTEWIDNADRDNDDWKDAREVSA